MTSPNIKLIPVPLGPFTSPTGPYDIRCDCDDCCGPDEDCPECHGTGRRTGTYTPCQRKSSEDDRIKDNAMYLGCIKDFWFVGHTSKQWYGWTIGLHQLNGIEFLYEMVVERGE